LRLISTLYRQIFAAAAAAALHANGLRIKLQQLKNPVRHVGVDWQASDFAVEAHIGSSCIHMPDVSVSANALLAWSALR
jgi:hypothetical protein